MRNSNINVRPRGSLGGVRRHTLTLLHIHQEPSGCHGKGEFLQYMTVQICHVLPISELPILRARFPSTVRSDHENGKKSRNQLGHTYDKNEKYLVEDSVSFIHEFTLSLAFHSSLIFFQSNFNNFSSPELYCFLQCRCSLTILSVFVRLDISFFFLLLLLEDIFIQFRFLCWQDFSFGTSGIL